MISRLIAKATLVGVAASLAVAAPAAAAPKPTLTGPDVVVGFTNITLTGTAAPGATVDLYEAAYKFRTDMYRAPDFKGGFVSAVADGQGKFTIQRNVDSGFVFYVKADGEDSDVITITMRQHPFFHVGLASPSNNTVTATVAADPGEPNLPVELQRQAANGTWTKIADGTTDGQARVQFNVSGVPAGSAKFRAFAGASPDNNVLAGPSNEVTFNVAGTGGPTTSPTTTPTTKPTATPTTSPSTSPKPSPTPPKPNPTPAAGSVIFTKIRYDSTGPDTGSNGSLNGEWVRLTNKTKSAINLRDWTVRDWSNHVYKFVGNYTLGAGQSVFIQTGKGTNVTGKRFWNRKGKVGYIWNNTGDVAYLRGPSGKNVDVCTWKGVGKGETNC